MRYLIILCILTCIGCTQKAVTPVEKPPEAELLSRDEFQQMLRQEIRSSIPAPQQSSPVDLSGLATREQIDAIGKELKAAKEQPVANGVPVAKGGRLPSQNYAYNATGEQVIYFFTLDNCPPCARFATEGHLVRINGQSVDWRPMSQCPVTFDTPPTGPTFFWQNASGEWLTLPDWNGPVDFQTRFSRPRQTTRYGSSVYGATVYGATTYGSVYGNQVPYGVTAAPYATYATYGMPFTTSITYGEPVQQPKFQAVPITRVATIPAVRYGPLGFPWPSRQRVLVQDTAVVPAQAGAVRQTTIPVIGDPRTYGSW